MPLMAINAFLANESMEDDLAEETVNAVLCDDAAWGDDALQLIADEFDKVFFYFPNGLQDRTVFRPVDAHERIANWRLLAEWRNVVHHNANADNIHFTTDERQEVFQRYLHDFTQNHLQGAQEKWNFVKRKSAAEARLNRTAGSKILVFAIWEVGLPRVPPRLATEQPRERVLRLQESSTEILRWLRKVSAALAAYKHTGSYQKALRKSGTVHGQRGLSATEQEAKASVDQAAWNMREGARLARLWDQNRVTYDTATRSQWHLLNKHWSGELQTAHAEAVRARGNQTVRMPQLFP